MIKELNHIGVRAADIDNALRFYVDVLDGTIIRNGGSADGKSRFIYVQLCDGVIELLGSKPGETNFGLQHVAFLVDCDLQAAYQTILAQGLVFTVPPRPAASGNGVLAFFHEPGGATFELIQREEDIRIPGLRNKYLLDFAFSTISVTGNAFDRCSDFYRNTMDFVAGNTIKTAGLKTRYFSHGPDTIELVATSDSTPLAQPLTHLTIRVADCLVMRDHLLAQGIACPMPEADAADAYQIMKIAGPDGVAIHFIDQPK
ncbi:MAG: VOC family protein [Bacillota bacterium]|nr:VOC family protein [Bacillota bacterium]